MNKEFITITEKDFVKHSTFFLRDVYENKTRYLITFDNHRPAAKLIPVEELESAEAIDDEYKNLIEKESIGNSSSIIEPSHSNDRGLISAKDNNEENSEKG